MRTGKAASGSHTMDHQQTTKGVATMIPKPSWFSLPPNEWPTEAREAYRFICIGMERAKRAKLAAMTQEQEVALAVDPGTCELAVPMQAGTVSA